MNRTQTTASAQNDEQAQQDQTSAPSFLHVSHNGPVDLEAYIHRYVDDLARAELDLDSSHRSE